MVVALVEHGGHGGSAAGPIVQKILARYFEKQRGEQAEPESEPGEPKPGGEPEEDESEEEPTRVARGAEEEPLVRN